MIQYYKKYYTLIKYNIMKKQCILRNIILIHKVRNYSIYKICDIIYIFVISTKHKRFVPNTLNSEKYEISIDGMMITSFTHIHIHESNNILMITK